MNRTLDENVLSSANGKFRFDDLPGEVDYTVVVEDYIPGQDVAIVQLLEGVVEGRPYKINLRTGERLPEELFFFGFG